MKSKLIFFFPFFRAELNKICNKGGDERLLSKDKKWIESILIGWCCLFILPFYYSLYLPDDDKKMPGVFIQLWIMIIKLTIPYSSCDVRYNNDNNFIQVELHLRFTRHNMLVVSLKTSNTFFYRQCQHKMKRKKKSRCRCINRFNGKRKFKLHSSPRRKI